MQLLCLTLKLNQSVSIIILEDSKGTPLEVQGSNPRLLRARPMPYYLFDPYVDYYFAFVFHHPFFYLFLSSTFITLLNTTICPMAFLPVDQGNFTQWLPQVHPALGFCIPILHSTSFLTCYSRASDDQCMAVCPLLSSFGFLFWLFCFLLMISFLKP